MERESWLPTGVNPQGVKLIRPLLQVSREEIDGWAQKQGVPHVSDSTNDKDDYLRNRLRHHLLPRLKEEIPDFIRHLSETCQALSEINEAVERKVDDYLGASCGFFKTKDYFCQPQEVRFRVLRAVLENGGYQKQFERKHFIELESILVRGKSFSREYGPAIFTHKKGVFTCSRPAAPASLD